MRPAGSGPACWSSSAWDADDGQADIDYMVGKIRDLKIFEDDAGKMDHSLGEVSGEALVVSQFTLYGDCRRGRRPSFDSAAPPEQARAVYDDPG